MKPIENDRNERLLAFQRERRRSLNLLALLPLAGALGACSGLIPGQGPPGALYRLTPKSSFREDLPSVSWQLVLETPVTDASLNTTKIGLQQSPTQMEYYARAGWADRAPLMVQTLMIESFENSRRIVAVGREAIGLRADFILKSELREFQAIYYEGLPPKTLVTINAKLVKMPQRTIIGSESFGIAIDAEADKLDEIIAAFDQALGKVLRRLVEWTLVTGEAAARTS
jgi:cholesterol transport system auxiliary component